jgi:ABC-type uncharacterized transport system permease subunit
MPRWLPPLVSVIAAFLHILLLYVCFEPPGGQNLSTVNMLSLSVWLMWVLILFASIRKPVENLLMFTAPLAIVSLVLIQYFPSAHVATHDIVDGSLLIHILLSVLMVSVLFIALLQAVLLSLQESLLRRKKIIGVVRMLPALDMMEGLLFQILWVGFVLLTLDLFSGLYFFIVAESVLMWDKIALVVFAWLLFAGLLVGRHAYGWRGRKIMYGTAFAVMLLFTVYLFLA